MQKIENDESIQKYNLSDLVKIQQIGLKNKSDSVTVMGIVQDDSVPAKIATKTREQLKRIFHIFDDSGYVVEVIIWGERCNMEGLAKGAVALVIDGKVNEFNEQKNITISGLTQIHINP